MILACLPADTARELQAKGELPAYYTSIDWEHCFHCNTEIAVGPKVKSVHEIEGAPYYCFMCVAASNLGAELRVSTVDEIFGETH